MVAYSVHRQTYVHNVIHNFNKLQVSVFALMVCRWQLVNAKDMDVFRHVSLVIRVPAVQLVVHRETCSSRLISAYALMDII